MTVFQNVRNGLIPARLTVADVYALHEQGVIAEDERFELIDGEIVPMAAAKFSPHEWMKSRFNEALVLGKPRDVGVFPETSITLAAATLVEPDLALWPRSIASRDVRGPDLLLVVEIAASSLAYDLREKAGVYARHGVRDYWVVDALRHTIRVHRAPADGFFTEIEEYDADVAVSALLLPGFAIRIDDLD